MKLRFPISHFLIWTFMLFLLLSFAGKGTAQEYQPSLLVYPPFGHSLGFHRAGTFYLKLLLGWGSRFEDPQGVACVRLAETDNPKTGDDDDDVTVYMVNSGRNQVIYNQGLTGLKSFGQMGSGPGQFHTPRGIAATEDGRVYVADLNNSRVVCLQNRKETLKFVRHIGEGELLHPQGCAVDNRGQLYVTDTGHNRVAVYDSLGNNISSFGGEGVLDEPFGIAVQGFGDSWTFFKETAVIVADSICARIQKFDQQGRLVARIANTDIGLPGAYFSYLALDYFGNLYATDMVNHLVHKFDRHLKYVASFGRQGLGEMEFESPRGIAVWKRFGQVFVMERESAQYYWIGIDGYIKQVSPGVIDSLHPGATIVLQLYEPADLNIQILDSLNQPVRQLLNEFREKLGENFLIWDGEDDKGKPAPAGEYTISVTMSPTYSAKGYFTKTVKAKVRKAE
jgi:DNA-binding beta-propeller fold protein YncE